MKNGLLGIIDTLAKKKKGKGVHYDMLANVAHAMKAVPANGKRWRKNEEPDLAELTFYTEYKKAMDAFRGEKAHQYVGVVLWFDADEFRELTKKDDAIS